MKISNNVVGVCVDADYKKKRLSIFPFRTTVKMKLFITIILLYFFLVALSNSELEEPNKIGIDRDNKMGEEPPIINETNSGTVNIQLTIYK